MLSTNKQRTPKETHCTIETFIKVFKNELQKEEQIKKKLTKSNLTKNHIEALKGLSVRNGIIITKAGKGFRF